MGDTTEAVSVEEMYGELPQGEEVIDALLDRSLDPRSPDMLFEIAGELGAGPDTLLLDVGCRDGRHMVELFRRFGCRTVGLELVWANLHRRRAVEGIADPSVRDRIHFVQGTIDTLPFPDGAFDLLWCRDMLIHPPDLTRALAECRRVLRPDARLLVFQMFATPWLEPKEAARLWPSVGAVPENTDPSYFERCVREAGLGIERRDEVSSEWREHAEESGRRITSTQLLRAARLLRDPDRFRRELGRTASDVELADCLWGVYQMIGKLSPRVYVLVPASHRGRKGR